jgi:hypothetical protein
VRLDSRRPGTSTTFIDAASGEDIFQLAADKDGILFLAFHLYDASGCCVAASIGLERHPDGLTVRCAGGELLLLVPADAKSYVEYRLYNSNGYLLTRSDGLRTMIYPLLRMEGVGRDWAPPAVFDVLPATAVEATR